MRGTRVVRSAVLLGLAALSLALTATLAPLQGAAATGRLTSASQSSIERPTSFIDTFDDNSTSGWSTVDEGSGTSHWYASRRRLVQGGGSTSTLQVAGDPGWANYSFAVTAKTSDADAFGLVFRYQDENNYYRFSVDHRLHYRRLEVKVDGAFHVLAQTRDSYRPGVAYRLRITAVGNRLQAFMNSTRVFDLVDQALPTGRIGLYTGACAPVSFDSVLVNAQTDDYFTVAVVPDTQFETSNHPAMLAAQMAWIARHRAEEHIAMVLQEGDIVDRMTSSRQWATARRYYASLDGKVPFVAAAGNHDIELLDGRRPYSKSPAAYNRFLSSFADYTVDGRYGAGDFRNTYHLFTAGGVDLMVLNLDFGPTSGELAWAGRVAAKYPHRHILLLTHDYLGTDGLLRGVSNPEDKTLPHNHNPAWNDGLQIWQKFVKLHPNVQFTLNGHVIQTVSAEEPWSVARLVAPDDAGRPVFQMLMNFQTTYPGGQGYLRLLRFYPRANQVRATTVSPYGAAELTDDRNQFTLDGADLGAW